MYTISRSINNTCCTSLINNHINELVGKSSINEGFLCAPKNHRTLSDGLSSHV